MTHQQALERYIQATNTHDFKEVKAILHPQAVYWFSDKTCTTIEEIEAYFKHAWHVIKEEVYSASNVKWLTIDEKTATCLYTYHYEGYHNEKFVSGTGRATNIFTWVNDEWKLIHEHLSGAY